MSKLEFSIFRRFPEFCAAAALLFAPTPTRAGSILREVWQNVTGVSVNDLRADPRYPDQPTSTNAISDLFEAPSNVDDSYGQRLHGYIIPPISGSYTFWIASDDASELWLSTDQTQANQKKIAFVTSLAGPRDWTKEVNQKSAAIVLQANHPYYIAALHKEGRGNDNLAVRWLRPDGVDQGPIPAAYLLPWGTVLTAPNITQQPLDLSVTEGQIANFSVQTAPESPSTVQWQHAAVDIPGAQSTSLAYGPVSVADQGAQFQAVLTDFMGAATSRVAVLTVLSDKTPPSLLSAANIGDASIQLNFSEPLDPISATDVSNYSISGGLKISTAQLSADGLSVILSTGLAPGSLYTVTVNGVKDRALLPNLIAAGTKTTFSTSEYTAVAIGGATNGNITTVEGGFDLAGFGTDIGGTGDQFEFGYQERSGNFDIKARVADLTISNPYVKAGLMVRDGLTANGRFAGMFASSAQLGSFFESRATANSAATITAPPTKFPANYPWAWVRLQRSGTTINGYGGFDGTNWQQLGTVTISLNDTAYFGLAVASQVTNVSARAAFRDVQNTSNPKTFTYVPRREPLGPSNRRTGMVFSEIMYHPRDRADGKNLEFVEVYNGEGMFIDLSGWKIAGGINFVFPMGFVMQAGQFAVIAADPAAISDVYGIQGVLGPFSGHLNNSKDTLQLLTDTGATRLDLAYASDAPWPASADGAGHSLVLSRPSYGENDPRAWGASQLIGGSPGQVDPIVSDPSASVVINEFLARTDDPSQDFIELFNSSTASVDISGTFLTDSPNTNKFQIPAGTIIGPRQWTVFHGTQFGFGLGSGGETIYFVSSNQNRVLDAVRFGGQEKGVSTGRSPDGGPVIRRLAAPTPGTANSARRTEDVVINEIMYKTINDDDNGQYVELYNRAGKQIDIGGWRFVSGIDYTFPAGASIPPGGYVVAARNLDYMLTNYTQLNPANTFGGFSASLGGKGDHLALAKPDQVVSTNLSGTIATNINYITIGEVSYGAGGRWPELAHAGGSSLELKDPHSDPLLAGNWAASDETQKAPWTTYSFTGLLDNGSSGTVANRFFIGMLGAGECLVDDLEILKVGGANLLSNGGFESGSTGWTFYGNHSSSKLQAGGAFDGNNCLHVIGSGDGDTANNTIRSSMTSALSANQTATIRARVRWLSGWPEVLFRLHGNWIEMPVHMQIPNNLGTPGMPNSRVVDNAGPAISDICHSPAVPAANESVVVSARIDDPDGVASPQVLFRVDPATGNSVLPMKDDGTGGDLVAGDGIFSATIPGKQSGTLVGFTIQASDDAGIPSISKYPPDSPARECFIRWGDTKPFGSFSHFHMWSDAATEGIRGRTSDLDNTFRDCTLVYNDFRVVYNAGFRDKGSPYHNGGGDFAATVPADDLLLGTDDRIFASTGNGGAESTQMGGDVSNWIAERMGLPFLHNQYCRLYRNGGLHNAIDYDLEQPNRAYAQDWKGGGGVNDSLYKISIWFEFDDSNTSFQPTLATLQKFQSAGSYKLARYRWNWQIRPGRNTVNDYTTLFNLATAANATDKVTQMVNLADMEQWMRVFAYERVIGNWDSWTYNEGQNMYLYTPLGERASLMPWDIDFVLGMGDAASNSLFVTAEDGVVGGMFALPTYKRMMLRAYMDAANGPLRVENSDPQFDARKSILNKNNVTITDPRSMKTYVAGRRAFIQKQLQTLDTPFFTITTQDFTSSNPLITITGTAPIAVSSLEVNGIPYPITWTSLTAWSIKVPVGGRTNLLQVAGRDLRGNLFPGASATLNVQYTGAIAQPQDWVVINEIMYNSLGKDAEFVEIFNSNPSVAFDLSGFKLSGAGFTFPPGSLIQPNGYLVVAKDSAAFADAYGAAIPVIGEFTGKLQHDGENLRLIKPGSTEADDLVIDEVRYEGSAPWPSTANGFGPSLQLIDAAQDNSRVGNWGVTAIDDINRATPGRANTVRNLLDPFPPIWINEILSNNQTGAKDNNGEREPWIELYNSGNSTLDLSPYYLSNDPSNPAQWQFPAGSSLAPGQFLVVWIDGQPSQSIPGALHANFRLDPTNGIVALNRIQLGAPATMDYINYVLTSADKSFGSIPDGDPRKRRLLFVPTPGAPNNLTTPIAPIFINEWMASNRSTLLDPITQSFEDWFEIYNAGTNEFDLSGFFLSDSATNKTLFSVPAGTTIPPLGFRLFWASGDDTVNGPGRDIHTNFKLSSAGEDLILSGPDETIIDSVTFGAQTDDVSQGRYPDGAAPPFFVFAHATPDAANFGQFANQLPVLAKIPDQTIPEGHLLTFKVSASDPDSPAQTLLFSLINPPAGAAINPSTGDFSWTPSEEQGPGVFTVTVRVTDNGSPALSASSVFKVTVQELNQAPTLDLILDATIGEGSTLSFQATASDADLPFQGLTFSLDTGAPEGTSIDPSSGQFEWTPTEAQGPADYTITIRVTDGLGLSAARTFTVHVLEVNNPPVISEIGPQSVPENSLFVYQIAAFDPDTPPAPLTYSLENAPDGASIDPVTGLFSWTPSEAQGPHDYNITVRVSEPGGEPSSTVNLVLGVDEVNTAPVLKLIPDYIVHAGERLSFPLLATDLDLPPQILTFSAVTQLPDGASIDPVLNFFVYQVPDDPIGGTNTITIRVSDNDARPLSADKTFRVVVVPPILVVINEIMHRPAVSGAEYIELANFSAVNPIDLSGWQLQGYDFNFPQGTILEPKSFICVAHDLEKFQATYKSNPRVLGNAAISIPSEGGLLRLSGPKINGLPGAVIDEVQFSLAPPWPAAAASNGASLQLLDWRQNHERVMNWGASIGTITNQPVEVIAMTNDWKYYQNATFPGSTWLQPSFNDSAWPLGRALLYVEESALPAPKNTPLTLGQLSYYFRTHFNFTGSLDGAQMQLNTIIDDGAIMYLNAHEIYRLGMPAGAITPTTLAARSVGNAVLEGPFDISPTGLVQGDNVLAVEVHQTSTGSSDIVLGLSAELTTVSASSFTPGAPNSFAAALPDFPSVWINEILPQNTTGITDNTGAHEPWIELYNSGTQAVALDDWSLTDDYNLLNKWMFPAGTTIPAGAYLLVWADGETGQSIAGQPHTSFRLNPAAGSIALVHTQLGTSSVVDYLDYSGIASNQSLGSLRDGTLWGRQTFTNPTPGTANFKTQLSGGAIQIVPQAGGLFAINVKTVAGVRYILQASGDLSFGTWLTVSDTIGDGTPISYVDSVKNHQTLFFRVLVE